MVLFTLPDKQPHAHISHAPVQIYSVQNSRFTCFIKQIINPLEPHWISENVPVPSGVPLKILGVYYQVLAHRGSLWTLLRSVCQTVWDHSCRIGVFAAQCELPVAPDQLQDTLTSLLVLSADLIMDMMHRLGVMITSSTTFDELATELSCLSCFILAIYHLLLAVEFVWRGLYWRGARVFSPLLSHAGWQHTRGPALGPCFGVTYLGAPSWQSKMGKPGTLWLSF